MHLPALISDLAVILLTGGTVTIVFKKLRLPLVLGYILAGFLIGPLTPFTLADHPSVQVWGDIGAIILMFTLGLHFDLHKLARVGGSAIISSLVMVGGMLLLGFAAGQLMGWEQTDSIFLGGMIALSSPTIIIRVFGELKVGRQEFARLVAGSLVVEDVAGIFMMVVLFALGSSQSVFGGGVLLQLGLLALYLAVWLIFGVYLLPTLLRRTSGLMTDEMLLIVSLGICFGMVLLADVLGFSSALGAFLAGSLLAGTLHAGRIKKLTAGVRDLFGAVFFIAVGLMLDPSAVAAHTGSILIITVVTLLGKFLFAAVGELVAGHSLRQAVDCACSLSQIGEFAFIIASLGISQGVLADYIYPVIVAVSVLTTLTTPFLIKNRGAVYDRIARLLPARLLQKLDRYTDEHQSERETDGDWTLFLRRYLHRTFFFGSVMLGAALLGQHILLPFLIRVLPGEAPGEVICLALIYLCTALFLRPMLDIHSPQFTTLWLKKRSFRPPLIALCVIRVLIVLAIIFLPLESIAGLNALWLLPLMAAAVFIASRFGWFSSAYFSVQARFLTNLNERQLQKLADSDDPAWLDERLVAAEFVWPAPNGPQTLGQLGLGRRYGVNVIRIRRGRHAADMPGSDAAVHAGDRVTVLGERENLRAFCLSFGLEEDADAPTLRAFSENEKTLFCSAFVPEADSPLIGRTIRDSRLRENYRCLILGLQRDLLPIVRPNVDLVIQSGDVLWLLGTRHMAEKLLADADGEEV